MSHVSRKTCIQGFRPGLTQTGLYRQRVVKSLEISDLASRDCTIYVAEAKAQRGNCGADLCLCFLICKTGFLVMRLN